MASEWLVCVIGTSLPISWTLIWAPFWKNGNWRIAKWSCSFISYFVVWRYVFLLPCKMHCLKASLSAIAVDQLGIYYFVSLIDRVGCLCQVVIHSKFKSFFSVFSLTYCCKKVTLKKNSLARVVSYLALVFYWHIARLKAVPWRHIRRWHALLVACSSFWLGANLRFMGPCRWREDVFWMKCLLKWTWNVQDFLKTELSLSLLL